MLSLPNYTYHTWHQFMYEAGRIHTGAKGVGTPMGIGPYLQICGMGLGGPLWSSNSEHYLCWKTGVSCRISSHMWKSWNFPRFLLRDGSLTYEYDFLDDSGNAMYLPTHNRKTVQIDKVSRRMTMFIYGGGGPKMFFQPIPKGRSPFPNAFFFTTCHWYT